MLLFACALLPAACARPAPDDHGIDAPDAEPIAERLDPGWFTPDQETRRRFFPPRWEVGMRWVVRTLFSEDGTMPRLMYDDYVVVRVPEPGFEHYQIDVHGDALLFGGGDGSASLYFDAEPSSMFWVDRPEPASCLAQRQPYFGSFERGWYWFFDFPYLPATGPWNGTWEVPAMSCTTPMPLRQLVTISGDHMLVRMIVMGYYTEILWEAGKPWWTTATLRTHRDGKAEIGVRAEVVDDVLAERAFSWSIDHELAVGPGRLRRLWFGDHGRQYPDWQDVVPATASHWLRYHPPVTPHLTDFAIPAEHW